MSNKVAPVADYDDAALSVLAYEFGSSDPGDSEKKIKRKLRDKKLGQYDEARIASLRSFRDAIRGEANLRQNSKYYTHSHGKYADIEDFDRSRMTEDYAKQFPGIPRATITSFVDFTIYLCYLR